MGSIDVLAHLETPVACGGEPRHTLVLVVIYQWGDSACEKPPAPNERGWCTPISTPALSPLEKGGEGGGGGIQ